MYSCLLRIPLSTATTTVNIYTNIYLHLVCQDETTNQLDEDFRIFVCVFVVYLKTN